MNERPSAGDRGPTSDEWAQGGSIERAHEIEDRLRIEAMAAALPTTGASPLRRRAGRIVNRAAATARRLVPSGDRRPPVWDGTGAGDSSGLRWAITVAAPNDRLAARWGDWHFASALARALERKGHVGLVRTCERAHERAAESCDVRLVIHGLEPFVRRTDQPCVLWVISHPDSVTSAECDRADLVLVASERFATFIGERTDTPVEVLLQATDPLRFRPMARVPEHQHPLLVVAKTRDVPRPIVSDAIAAGLRPAIYGTGWRDLVDRDLIIADYISNSDLPEYYCSAGVVLNDHWDDMRRWGFVSNRLFDVVACGTPTVSDHLPEIGPLFGDAVATYRDPNELFDLVQSLSRDPRARQRVLDQRRAVVARHTFDHRAEALVELVGRYGLAPARPADGSVG